MDDFYRVMAIAGAAVVAAGALWTVVRLQREHPFSWLGTFMAGAGVAVSLVIYILIVDIELKQEAVWGLLGGGALAGAFLGARIPLYRRESAVVSKAAGWHLALPAVAIAAFQVMGVRESIDGIILSFAALHAATAFAVAACALLLVRRLAVGPTPAPARGRPAPPTVAASRQCPRCGSPIRPNWHYCMGCGASL
jgi:hypothetical protein